MSLSLRDRGQTTQDFIVGIGVFILAVAFVFSFLPTMLTPFDSSTSGGQTAQADRIADKVVDELSTESESPNEISWDEMSDDETVDELGLRTNNDDDPIERVNVSLQSLNESTTVEGFGPEYNDQSAASSARIVTVESGSIDDDDECEPACRLVVRIW